MYIMTTFTVINPFQVEIELKCAHDAVGVLYKKRVVDTIMATIMLDSDNIDDIYAAAEHAIKSLVFIPICGEAEEHFNLYCRQELQNLKQDVINNISGGHSRGNFSILSGQVEIKYLISTTYEKTTYIHG